MPRFQRIRVPGATVIYLKLILDDNEDQGGDVPPPFMYMPGYPVFLILLIYKSMHGAPFVPGMPPGSPDSAPTFAPMVYFSI